MVVVAIRLAYATATTSLLPEAASVGTRSMFAATSTPALAIRDLSWLVLGICAVIFVTKQVFIRKGAGFTMWVVE
jgi:hypothetical protein